MEAARIKPDSPNKAVIALSLCVIFLLSISIISGNIFAQGSHEVGLNDNYIAGIYGSDNNYHVVTGIKVYRNTPNPFSTSTTIKFENAEFTNLKISIYDKDGNLVKACLYDNIKPGMHEVNIDGSEFPAGDYTYRVTSGNYSQSYKMNLVK